LTLISRTGGPLNDGSEIYPDGTVVTLTASADPGSIFSGWAGACTGCSDCQVTMTEAKAVTAAFDARSAYLPIILR